MDLTNLELHELIENRNKANLKKSELLERYGKLESDLAGIKKSLSMSQRKYAVMNQEINDIKNEMFLLKKSRCEMDETSSYYLNEIESKEIEHKGLVKSKSILSSKVDLIEKIIENYSETWEIENAKKEKLFTVLNEMDHKRKKLAYDIDVRLASTSLKKEQIMEELDELNKNFITSIEDRMKNKQKLSGIHEQLKNETQKKSDLKNHHKSLSILYELNKNKKDLSQKLERIINDHNTISEKYEVLKKHLKEKKALNEKLSKANNNHTIKIKALEEEVLNYDLVASASENAKQKYQASIDLYNQNVNELRKTLSNNIKYEEALAIEIKKADSLTSAISRSF